MKKISMKDLYHHLEDLGENEIILDVRNPEEYFSGHVPGSINIPVDDLPGRLDELEGYQKIYVHCKMGGRAQRASEFLQQEGFDNLVCIAGSGMQAWIESGYPIEKD